MAYRASAYFKGNARKPFPSGFHTGATMTVQHTHVFDSDPVLAADVLELLPWPAGARLIAFTYVTENLPAGNDTLGLMSGTPGTPDGARTVGTELVNAVAHVTTDTSLGQVALTAVAASDSPRSIGYKPSADISVNANRKLHVRATFQFG